MSPLILPAPAPSPQSTSDLAGVCLRDIVRTEMLLTAVRRIVRPGDVVVEVGPGSGILSLEAARRGAARVYAVELDPFLAEAIEATAARNGFADRIAVIAGDALTVELPSAVDVVIAELIETGLIDEMQVPVGNSLHRRGVIGPATRLIPRGYTTSVELVDADTDFYGYHIEMPLHDWPDQRHPEGGWYPIRVRPLTERAEVATVDLHRPVEPRVERRLTVRASADGIANAVRLSGIARLAPGLSLGATNAINGDKIIRLEEPAAVRSGDLLDGTLSYEMGGGLGTVRWRWEMGS